MRSFGQQKLIWKTYFHFVKMSYYPKVPSCCSAKWLYCLLCGFDTVLFSLQAGGKWQSSTHTFCTGVKLPRLLTDPQVSHTAVAVIQAQKITPCIELTTVFSAKCIVRLSRGPLQTAHRAQHVTEWVSVIFSYSECHVGSKSQCNLVSSSVHEHSLFEVKQPITSLFELKQLCGALFVVHQWPVPPS